MMERKVILKRCKGLLALVLTFVMIFGSGIYTMAEEVTEAILVTTEYQAVTDPTDPYYVKPGANEEEYTGGGKHVHDYQWTVTLEPTEGTDGRSVLVCNCGDTAEIRPISYYALLIKRIIKSIEDAPANGTVKLDNPFLSCLTDEIMEALHKRGDVNLEVSFQEEEKDYSFVVPAGKALLDEEWYGYFYLGSIFGWK